MDVGADYTVDALAIKRQDHWTIDQSAPRIGLPIAWRYSEK